MKFISIIRRSTGLTFIGPDFGSTRMTPTMHGIARSSFSTALCITGLRRSLMRTVLAAIFLTIALSAMPARAVGWTGGTFQANGKPVQEFHCAPSGAGPFPVVIMLHGAGPRGMVNGDMEDFCGKLADQGYYTEFIEYYSQTSDVSPAETAEMAKDFPIWIGEIHAGISALKDNHTVNSKRVGMMGFSLGAYLSLAYGATYPDDIAAIVEFYGGLTPELDGKAATMPPVLILHGSGDKIVPVSQCEGPRRFADQGRQAAQDENLSGRRPRLQFCERRDVVQQGRRR